MAAAGPDPVATALNTLGVDTTPTKRKGPTGNDLPSGFAPLGTSSAYGDPPDYSNQSAAHATDAVLLVGPTLPSDSQKLYPSNLMKITGANVTGSTPDYGTASALQSFDASTYPWAAPSNASGIDHDVQSLRSVATGDLDGDGLQELVAAYVAPPASAGADPTLKIDIVQDSKEGYAHQTYTVGDALGVTDVSVVTGDFNGDGTSDIAIATATADHGSLLFLKGASANYQVDAVGHQDVHARHQRDRRCTSGWPRATSTTTAPTSWPLVVDEFDPAGPPAPPRTTSSTTPRAGTPSSRAAPSRAPTPACTPRSRAT